MKIQDVVLAKLLEDMPIPSDIDDVISMKFYKEMTSDNVDFQQELFGLFLDNARANIRGLIEAFETNDNDKWHFVAHNFKGSAATVCCFGLSYDLEYAQNHKDDSREKKAKLLQEIKEKSVKAILYIEKFFDDNNLERQYVLCKKHPIDY